MSKKNPTRYDIVYDLADEEHESDSLPTLRFEVALPLIEALEKTPAVKAIRVYIVGGPPDVLKFMDPALSPKRVQEIEKIDTMPTFTKWVSEEQEEL